MHECVQNYWGNQAKENVMGGHVARMGRGEVRTGFLWGRLTGTHDFEDLDIDGRIVFKWK
jgi:hypothetical protein